MHGIYQIVVEDESGRRPTESFHAETHPLVGGVLRMPDGYLFTVKVVEHVLKKDRNGGQPAYTAFSHVRLVVSNEEF